MATLREGDAWAFLSLKKQMVEADHLAVFSDGRKLPVFIYNNGGQTQYCIEGENCFYEAQKYSGFVRFEKIPEPLVEPPAPIPPTETDLFEAAVKEEQAKNPGDNSWVVRRRVNDRFFREGLTRQQQGRQSQQTDFTLPDRWAGFAAAAKRARNSR
jgi:hypothetical protein